MIVELNYLETPYLEESYLGVFVTQSISEQIEFKIVATKSIKEQVDRNTSGVYNAREQIDRLVTGFLSSQKEQVDFEILDFKNILEQANRITSEADQTKEQIDRRVTGFFDSYKEEIKRGKFVHAQCGAYLDYGYLTEPYLGPKFCVYIPEQINLKTTQEKEINEQVERKISVVKRIKEQISRRIDTIKSIREQIARVRATSIMEQITIALYNDTNLRVLCDFPSRGTNGLNWTASSTAAGDFSVNNLNTDIVEQIWKSNGVVSGLILTCDTGVVQGIFMDTMAILSHNLTTSASMIAQGSNDPGFSSVGFSHSFAVKLLNNYYIAPTLPTESYRYWRFLISDPTNTTGSISIGTIVFGSSVIMQQTCITQTVSKSTKHFSDKVATEGFTNVSNDRSLKYAVGMEMRNLKYNVGDYNRLRGVFDTARTSLKCLWIPTPKFPDRFATFAKLTSIPVEQHNVISEDADYVSFSIEVDESL